MQCSPLNSGFVNSEVLLVQKSACSRCGVHGIYTLFLRHIRN